MLKFSKWMSLVCAILWIGLMVTSLFLENANYKLLFIVAAITLAITLIINFITFGDDNVRKTQRSDNES